MTQAFILSSDAMQMIVDKTHGPTLYAECPYDSYAKDAKKLLCVAVCCPEGA